MSDGETRHERQPAHVRVELSKLLPLVANVDPSAQRSWQGGWSQEQGDKGRETQVRDGVKTYRRTPCKRFDAKGFAAEKGVDAKGLAKSLRSRRNTLCVKKAIA